jgi:hypothetical protein
MNNQTRIFIKSTKDVLSLLRDFCELMLDILKLIVLELRGLNLAFDVLDVLVVFDSLHNQSDRLDADSDVSCKIEFKCVKIFHPIKSIPKLIKPCIRGDRSLREVQREILKFVMLGDIVDDVVEGLTSYQRLLDIELKVF